MAAYRGKILIYIRKTFGTWQKPGGNRGWRLIEEILYIERYKLLRYFF